MAKFEIAEAITGRNEGGYANHPDDNGGETYAGIARNFWPQWEGWKRIDFIKSNYGKLASTINNYARNDKELVKAISSFYKANFWDVNKLDRFHSQDIANEVYDTGVNMGTNAAAEFLQRALNVANMNRQLYPDLIVDGDIGQKTLDALNKANTSLVFKILNVLQGAKYIDICEANKSQEVFVRSWFSRVEITK